MVIDDASLIGWCRKTCLDVCGGMHSTVLARGNSGDVAKVPAKYLGRGAWRLAILSPRQARTESPPLLSPCPWLMQPSGLVATNVHGFDLCKPGVAFMITLL